MTSTIYPELALVLRSLTDVPDSELSEVSALFRPTTVQRGTMLLQAGDIPHTLAFVVSGLLRLYYLDANGNEFTKSFCCEHDIVASYSALLMGTPSRLFIDALEHSTLLIADYQDY